MKKLIILLDYNENESVKNSFSPIMEKIRNLAEELQ